MFPCLLSSLSCFLYFSVNELGEMLKEELKARALSATGNKDDLIERLKADMTSKGEIADGERVLSPQDSVENGQVSVAHDGAAEVAASTLAKLKKNVAAKPVAMEPGSDEETGTPVNS